ncbi:unnamed protein product, partial [marine sediment metagenome]
QIEAGIFKSVNECNRCDGGKSDKEGITKKFVNNKNQAITKG